VSGDGGWFPQQVRFDEPGHASALTAACRFAAGVADGFDEIVEGCLV
jgi:hypothetical protein